MSDTLTAALRDTAQAMETAFDELLLVPNDARARLYQAMRHATMDGGKRLRPLLVLAAAALFAVPRAQALRVATAIECIHVYSLIHDDLPCMDDDALRRGKPTVHIAFDEATAVLAGDALHALAFELLADEQTHASADVRCALIAALATAAGPVGMAGGQMMDLVAETTHFDLAAITQLQALKTGALIQFAVEAGAILGLAEPHQLAALSQYAAAIGLAFQIADDLLDFEGDAALAGKALQKDAVAGKATFVSLLGVEAARAHAQSLVEEATTALAPFSEKAKLLREIAHYTLTRDR